MRKLLPGLAHMWFFILNEPHPLWPWDSCLQCFLVMVSVTALGWPVTSTYYNRILTLAGREALLMLCGYPCCNFSCPILTGEGGKHFLSVGSS